jgi:hypothetical protein
MKEEEVKAICDEVNAAKEAAKAAKKKVWYPAMLFVT